MKRTMVGRFAAFCVTSAALFSGTGRALAEAPDSTMQGGLSAHVVHREYGMLAGGTPVMQPLCTPEEASEGCNLGTTEFIGHAYYPDPTQADVQTHLATHGPLPVVVLVHGQHAWCYDPATGATSNTDAFPCVAPQLPVPNHRGYDYIAQVLASHGYLVISPSMNNANAARTGHVERAKILEMHLAGWEQVNQATADPATYGDLLALAGAVDLRNVGTMGHSRGGTAVIAHQVLYKSTSPYRVRAVLPAMPTLAFDALAPISGVPLGIFVTGCDGETYDLPGLSFFDESRYAVAGDQAAKYSFYLPGGNHAFSNTVWTPECWTAGTCPEWDLSPGASMPAQPSPTSFVGTFDDFQTLEATLQQSWELDVFREGPFPGPDAFCSTDAPGNGRLTAAEQRSLTLAYVAAFFRHYLGGEEKFGPLLQGDEGAIVDAEQLVRTAYHPPAYLRSDVHPFAYDSSDEYADFNEQGGTLPEWLAACGTLAAEAAECFPRDDGDSDIEFSNPYREAHFKDDEDPMADLGFELSRARVPWTMSLKLDLPVIPDRNDITRYTTFQFRAGFDYADPANPSPIHLGIQLSDGAGRTITASTQDQLGPNVLERPDMGSYTTVAVSHTVRIPLSAFQGNVDFDFTSVTGVSFLLGEAGESPNGSLLLSDVAFSGEAENLPSDVVMVLDVSGSMEAVDFTDVPDSRLTIALKGVRHFAASLEKGVGNRVALVTYSTDAGPSPLNFVDVVEGFDLEGSPFDLALDEVLDAGPQGSTSIGDGLGLALDLIAGAQSLATGRKPAILLFTDGRQNEVDCLGIRDGAFSGVDSGECTYTDPVTELLTDDDPRLEDVPICSIGLGRTAGQVDERLLETFSDRYLDSQADGTVLTTSAADFAKCIPTLSPQGMAIDPSGILPRNAVSTPAYTYDSAGDQALNFVSSWSSSTSNPGDMRLFVTAPDGDLLLPGEVSESLTSDHHNQFTSAPQLGSWRIQYGREMTRVVNGFTSDAFEDMEEGVSLVRRQLQRLCPEGCSNVLYFEDGRAGTSGSVYAEALDRERVSGLVDTVDALDESDSAAFQAALLAGGFDLLVYVHQLDSDTPGVTEVYDDVLQAWLCETTVPAIVTDTRGPVDSFSFPYLLSALGSMNAPTSVQIQACSGAIVHYSGTNYSELVDHGGTLMTGSSGLVDRGYDVFSYRTAALDWDSYHPYIGASQLDVATEAPVFDSYLAAEFGAVTTFSADQSFECALSYGYGSYACPGGPRARHMQRWSSQVYTRGYAPITPELEVTDVGDPDGIRVKFCFDRFLPPGGITATEAYVDVVYPTVDLVDVLHASTCEGDSSPAGDAIPGDSTSISLDDIPVSTTTVTLNDDGLGGDLVAGDLCFSASAPSLGQVTGTYSFTYHAEIEFVDEEGNVQTMHREEKATQYVGEEVLANGSACLPPAAGCDGDTEPPVIDSASTSSSSSTCSNGPAPVEFQAPTATDNCGVSVVVGAVIASNRPSVSVPQVLSGTTATLPPGQYTIEWTAYDAAGNASTTIAQNVEVQPGFAANGSLRVGNDSRVLTQSDYGAVANAGAGLTEIGNAASVGDLDATGNVKLWHEATVYGDLRTAGTLNAEASASVEGDTTLGTPVSITVQNLTAVAFPTTAGSLILDSGESETLDPGGHPIVILNSGSQLTLEPGDHYFEELHVNSASAVIQAPNGTRLFVKTKMSFRSPIVRASGGLSTVFVGYRGTQDLVLEANFLGTIVAPNALVRLGTASAQSFSGALHAKSIDLTNGADFICVPTSCLGATCDVVVPPSSCDDEVQNGDEEGVDCGGSCSSPCPAVCLPGVYEAETMFHSAGSSLAGGWNLHSNGFVSTTHDFAAGASQIVVRAAGQQAYGWPHMVVRVDGVWVGEAYVSTSNWTDYGFSYTSSGGPEVISVTFDNDKYAPPYDRNLLLDRVSVTCP